MDKLLEIIYDDYFDLGRVFNFATDREYMRLVYELRNIKEEFNIYEFISNYKDKNITQLLEKIKKGNTDKFFAEKEVLHFVYPFEQTIERFQIIYMTVGGKMWKDVFKFDYKIFINFLYYILFRISNYNYYRMTKDHNKKEEYKELFPLSVNYYFTKEEFYSFFQNDHDSVDNILALLSIEIDEMDCIEDTYRLLKYHDKYILYFSWDFIYHSYDLIENRIIDYYRKLGNEEEYYKKRGIEFEKYCFNALGEVFPKPNLHKNLCYNDNKGNHEIDILLDTNKEIIVFECKSSKFDIHKTTNDIDLKKDFLKAFGNSFKTLNDFNNYIKGNNIELYSKGSNEKYLFDFDKKNVIYISITLHNVEYLQTNIQKIDKELFRPVEVYPINWNFIDFLTILELIKMNSKPIFEYINKRFKMLNENKEITLDVDEIDALGFLTDCQNERLYKMIINNEYKVDMTLTINNGIYRTEINNLFNKRMFDNMFKKKKV